MGTFLKETEIVYKTEAQRRINQVTKLLHSHRAVEQPMEYDVEQLNTEKTSAANFINSLKQTVLILNCTRSTIEIDQKIQEFSSKFCEGISCTCSLKYWN